MAEPLPNWVIDVRTFMTEASGKEVIVVGVHPDGTGFMMQFRPISRAEANRYLVGSA